ncbi:MAG: glycosyltransferase family 4 protein [Deltaproteobacteria bacterium]|jgi:glycosyltransferase involved in cell wall biosynthesis|nr:glycosyltransferase family 4 protein [Deltaproteobacteria bacterium]
MGLTIGFFTDGQSFEGDATETGALGGSETAFIQITRALAKQGHTVMAFNNCQEAKEHCGVSYHPFRKSLQLLASQNFDVIVVSRFFGFFSLPIKSRIKVLWNHDTLDNPQALRAINDEIDLIFVLSEFHRNNYLTRLPELDDRTVVTRNGLDLKLLEEATRGVKKVPGTLIYASRPERGLKHLLEEIWPRLSRARSDLKLYLCGYNVNQKLLNDELIKLYQYLSVLASKDDRIINLGCLSKAEYYRKLAESEILVYPCIFPEVSCLAVLEAQAVSTAVLTTDGYALSESVALPEFKIAGRPYSPSYIEKFVERALKFLSDGELLDSLAKKSSSMIKSRYSWEQVAKEWGRLFDLSLRSKDNHPHFLQIHQKGTNALLV